MNASSFDHKYEKNERSRLAHLIYRRVFLWLLVFYMVLILGVLSFFLSHRAYQQERLRDAFSKLIGEHLYAYDLNALQLTIREFVDRERYNAIQILDVFGTPVGHYGNTTPTVEADLVIKLENKEGGISGEIRLWYKTNNYILIFYPIGFLVALGLAVMSDLVLRHIIEPKYQDLVLRPIILLRELLDSNFDKNKLDTMIAQFEQTPFEQLQNDLIKFLLSKQDVEKNQMQLRSALDFVMRCSELNFEQERSSVILFDRDCRISWSFISENMREADINAIAKLCLTRRPLSRIVLPETIEAIDQEHFEGQSSSEICFLKLRNNVDVKVQRYQCEEGQILVLFRTLSISPWVDQWLDESLVVANVGLTVFERDGQMSWCIGQNAKFMVSSLKRHKTFSLSDILTHFPVLEDFEENPQQSLTIHTKEERYFRVIVRANRNGRVAIFHQDITQDHVRKKQMLESQRLRELGEIASGIAHDFNNALGIITGQLEIAQMSDDERAQRGAMEIALDAARQAAGVVAQLMAYSRNQVLDAKIVHIDGLIKRNQRVIQTALTARHKLYLKLRAGAYCYIDPEFLTASIINLVINARDAMPEAGEVIIETKAVNGALELYVRDTGNGIPFQVQKKIFDPFFSTKPTGEGNGLGLSLVKGFVEQSNGKIDFETSSEGTSMRVTLSTVEVNDDSKGYQDTKKSKPSGKYRLLLVDDDASVLLTQATLLRTSGHEVFEFSDPEEASLFLQKSAKNIDLAIIDIQMPKINGLEMAEKVRRFNANIQIVLCSGNLSPDVLERSKAMSIHHYVEKPVKLARLNEVIEDAMANMAC